MENSVVSWDKALIHCVESGKTPPPAASRCMAMVHDAIFDAVNAVNGSPYEGYAYQTGPAKINVPVDAVVAATAYNIMKSLFPAEMTSLDASYNNAISSIPHDAKFDAAINLGKDIAATYLQLRTNDGSEKVVNYTPKDGAGNWQPTPPANADALFPQWPLVKTWALESGSQFRPNQPPALTSEEYTKAFNEVKAIGSKTSTVRTAEQTEIAKFWADGAGTATPPGHWHEIAQELAVDKNLNLIETARMFAQLSTTVADAGIAAWDAKYAYSNWRPVTAIRNADIDGNANTAKDAAWEPLLTTPAFPDYISGHSTFSGGAAAVLKGFFGTDNVAFTTHSDGLPGVTRSFSSFSQAAEEAGRSRIYGGIHWEFSNQAGLETGRKIGEYVADNFMLSQKFLSDKSDNIRLKDSSERVIHGMNGNDTIKGSAQDEKLYGDSGNDSIMGNNGDDSIYGGDGADKIWGGAGNDSIKGGGAFDTIYGDAGSDRLYGDAGNDVLYGGAGDDVIYGGTGTDRIYGDAGDDKLYGDAGRDHFYFASGSGHDSIYGFEKRNDIIHISANANGTKVDTCAEIIAAGKAVSGGVLISLGGENTLFIADIKLTDLSSRDFDFM